MTWKTSLVWLAAATVVVSSSEIPNVGTLESHSSVFLDNDCGTDHEITSHDRWLEDQAEIEMFGNTVRCVGTIKKWNGSRKCS
jgi:hypothetical protein